MVRSEVIPIGNSQFPKKTCVVPFCSFLFFCVPFCSELSQRQAEVRLAACGQLAWHPVIQPRFQPNLGLGKRSQGGDSNPGLSGRIGMDRELSQLAALRQTR